MKFIDDKVTGFMREYINNTSPVTHEASGQRIWVDFLSPYLDDLIVNNYGSVAGVINPGKDKKVVIEAHADEICWYVNYIDENGLIHLVRNGGADPVIAPSKAVKIHTRHGMVDAVFGWAAIQTRTKMKKDPKPTERNVFLDCGCCSRAEVEKLGVHPGCVVTFTDTFHILNDTYYVGRALDNRIGGVAIAQVARLLKKHEVDLPYSLYIVNDVQEEVGKHGAEMMANIIKPDIAIVTDVTHDTCTPGIDPKIFGDIKCGKGPVLTYAPPVHNKLLQMLLDTAADNNICVQTKAANKSTGTDTDAFAYKHGGIVSALVSLPQRYMHTTVEMVHMQDVENLVALLYFFLSGLKPETNFKPDISLRKNAKHKHKHKH